MLKLFLTIFMVGIMISSLGYARRLHEDFQDYDVGNYTDDYIYYTDSSGDRAYPTYIDEVENGIQAGGFSLSEEDGFGNELMSPGDWVYWENYDEGKLSDNASVAKWFEAHLAFVPNENITHEPNPSLVDEVWYYIYADTTGDGDDDTYFESQATGADDPDSPLAGNFDILQAYPRRYFDGKDEWDEWDPETWDFIASTNEVPTNVLESLTAVGIQFRTAAFDPDGEEYYMDIWVDNFVVPEPSMFVLLLGGFGFTFLFRGRRDCIGKRT